MHQGRPEAHHQVSSCCLPGYGQTGPVDAGRRASGCGRCGRRKQQQRWLANKTGELRAAAERKQHAFVGREAYIILLGPMNKLAILGRVAHGVDLVLAKVKAFAG